MGRGPGSGSGRTRPPRREGLKRLGYTTAMPLKPSATGRYLVLLCPDKVREGAKKLADTAQIRVARHAGKRSRSGRSAALRDHCAVIFDHIGVALVRCTPDKQHLLANLAAERDSAILAVEPERTVHASASRRRVSIPTPVPGKAQAADVLQAYLQGYRDGIEDLSRRLPIMRDADSADSPRFDESAATWGVQAVGAHQSSHTGKNIRIAVLDTGLDLGHPDFSGRKIVTRSFIAGQTAQDDNGHGTHCAGIAAGPPHPSSGPRYGVAGDAELYIGKVLGDEGSGGDGGVLEGIDWAIEHQCQIISMSLGSPVQAGQAYSSIFEEVARRALSAGTVIIAAAGNDSRRPGHIAPVSHPANCPSIMAVAAVDQAMQVAAFSSGGLLAEGGKVDIAAPGVDVLSSWPTPQLYNTISGTSMATPFVAGAAALYAQADTNARGQELLDTLLRRAAALGLPERDTGAGLVQVP